MPRARIAGRGDFAGAYTDRIAECKGIRVVRRDRDAFAQPSICLGSMSSVVEVTSNAEPAAEKTNQVTYPRLCASPCRIWPQLEATGGGTETIRAAVWWAIKEI